MFSRSVLLAMGQDDPEFVRAQGVFQAIHGVGGNQPFSMTDHQVGDLMFIGVGWTSTKPTVTGGDGTASWSWDLVTSPSASAILGVLWKRLSAADISAGTINVARAGDEEMFSVAYRGPRSAAVRTKGGSVDSAGTLTLTGYTPGHGEMGAVALVFDRDPFVSAPSTPTGFTSRISGGSRPVKAVDNVQYRGGDVTFTGFQTTSAQVGILMELLEN